MRALMIFFLIIAGSVLMGCHSSKSVLPSAPVIVSNSDSVKTEYIETVRIDTVRVEIPVPMESASQIVRDSVSYLETNFAESYAWLNQDGSIGHSIKNKTKSVCADVMVPNKNTETRHQTTGIKEIPIPYPEYVEVERAFTAWEAFRLKAFWYMLSICFACVLFIFRKPLFAMIRKCHFV